MPTEIIVYHATHYPFVAAEVKSHGAHLLHAFKKGHPTANLTTSFEEADAFCGIRGRFLEYKVPTNLLLNVSLPGHYTSNQILISDYWNIVPLFYRREMKKLGLIQSEDIATWSANIIITMLANEYFKAVYYPSNLRS